MGIESINPAQIGRTTENPPTDKWHWLMASEFDDESYGQRWRCETMMFMLSLSARTHHTRWHGT